MRGDYLQNVTKDSGSPDGTSTARGKRLGDPNCRTAQTCQRRLGIGRRRRLWRRRLRRRCLWCRGFRC
jgi:hypothetical protein